MQVKRQTNGPKTEAFGAAASPETETIVADICVIGGGPGGLSVAAAGAAFGRKVVLVERHKMGGDCLNYGCIPSKALLAAGKRAHAMRTAAVFGISGIDPGNRSARGAQPRARCHCGDSAQQLGRALHRARRACDPGRRPLHRQVDSRCRRIPHQGASLRAGDRLCPAGAADPRPRQRPLLHQ